MERRRVALTFDVDLVDWVSGQRVDELADVLPTLLDTIDACGDIRATFFVRIDHGIAQRCGHADYAITSAGALWQRARRAGHEVAWHYHGVMPHAQTEAPDDNAARLLSGLHSCAPLALAHGCNSVRMGWGQHTADTLSCLADHGFRADSSAMPREVYAWDPPLRDWSRTPARPYRPSRRDAQRPEIDAALPIWEIPMTMQAIASPGDTRSDVRRYLNPAYHPPVFSRAIADCAHDAPLVLISHPYEAVGGRAHPLYAFSMEAIRANLCALNDCHTEWVTIATLAQQLDQEHAEATHAHAA